MAQRIYWQYKDDDSTFDLNSRQVGIIPFGRYKGFDAKVSDMYLSLEAQESGIGRVQLDLSTVLSSVWVTRQGAVVTEPNDGTIYFPISNGDATHPRIDIVVGTHNHVESTGGIAATYSIVEGTPAAEPVAPNVLDPTTDVIIGYLTVPAGTTELTEEMWAQARIPDFADDETITHLDKIQKFVATQFMHSMYMNVCFGAYRLSDSSLHLGIAGSFFSANFPANQDGEYYVVDGTTTGALPTGYVPVEAITFPKARVYNPTDPPKAQRKVVVSSFPIELIPSNYLTLPNDCPVRIESNEPFILEQVIGNTDLFGNPSDYVWYLASGGQVNKGGVNKVTGLISHAYETATVNTVDNSLPRNENQPRNIIRLADAGSFSEIQFIQSQQYSSDGSLESGTTLTIYPYEGDTLYVSAETSTSPTPPLGYKPIRNSAGGDFYITSGPLVVQEMDDYFEVIGGTQLQPLPVTLTSGLFSTSGNKGQVFRNPDGFLVFDGFADLSPSSNTVANSVSVIWSMPLTTNPIGQAIYRIIPAPSWTGTLFEENGSGVVLATYHVMLSCVDGVNVRLDYHPALTTSKRYVLFLNGMRVKARY